MDGFELNEEGATEYASYQNLAQVGTEVNRRFKWPKFNWFRKTPKIEVPKIPKVPTIPELPTLKPRPELPTIPRLPPTTNIPGKTKLPEPLPTPPPSLKRDSIKSLARDLYSKFSEAVQVADNLKTAYELGSYVA